VVQLPEPVDLQDSVVLRVAEPLVQDGPPVVEIMAVGE
jgi:hypothetical protein